MFCAKCGNQMKDGELFCANCGTRINEVENPMKYTANPEPTPPRNINNNYVVGIEGLGKIKNFFFASIALIVLSLFFSFFSTICVYSDITGQSDTASLFSNIGAAIFFTLFYLIGIVVMLLPLLLKKQWSAKYFLPIKIIMIMSFLFFLIAVIDMYAELDHYASYWGGAVKGKICVTGWLYAISTVGALILSYKNTIDMKKANIIPPKAPKYNQNGYVL